MIPIGLKILRPAFAAGLLCTGVFGAAPLLQAAQPPDEQSPQTMSSPNRQSIVLDSTSALADYVAFAVEHNPGLRAQAELLEASRLVPAQARSLPDPVLSFTQYFQSPETRVGPWEHDVVLSQRLPFFGKRGLKGEVAEREAGITGRAYDASLLDLVRAVKQAYYEYYRIYHAIQVTEEERTVLDHMEQVAQVKYASGMVSQQDVLKAQLALSTLSDRLTQLNREMVTVKARLNRLLNRAPDAELAVPRREAIDIGSASLQSLHERAGASRPELAAAGLSVERAEKTRALAGRDYYPDLTLAFGYGIVGKRPEVIVEDNGKDIVRLTASINIPLWFGKQRAGVKEAEARIASARNHREAVRREIESEVEDAYSRVRSAKELVTLYEDVILPQAEQTFLASEAGYRTGKVDFLNYLDSERTLLTLKRTYFRLVADLGKEHADFERALGGGLESLPQ